MDDPIRKANIIEIRMETFAPTLVPALYPRDPDHWCAALGDAKRFFLAFNHIKIVGRMQDGVDGGDREEDPRPRRARLEILDRVLLAHDGRKDLHPDVR